MNGLTCPARLEGKLRVLRSPRYSPGTLDVNSGTAGLLSRAHLKAVPLDKRYVWHEHRQLGHPKAEHVAPAGALLHFGLGVLHPPTCVAAEVWMTCQSSGRLAASASGLAASSSTTAEGCSVQRAAAATLISPPGPCKRDLVCRRNTKQHANEWAWLV